MNDYLADLLSEIEETLRSEGHLPLYDFSWSARGLNADLSEAQIGVLCQQAYDAMSKRHEFQLMWFDWPLDDLRAGRAAELGTPLDFDINTTGTITSPYLVLVPRNELQDDQVKPADR